MPLASSTLSPLRLSLVVIALAAGTAHAAPPPQPAPAPPPAAPDSGAPEDVEPPTVPAAPAPSESEAAVAAMEPAPLQGATRLDADGLFESERRAYGLYLEGVTAFETDEDVDAAIAKWQEALATLPDERPYARSRGALALRLVLAHEKRFYRDGELDDIYRQVALLRGYQARLPEMFPDDPAARARRRDHAQVRIDQLHADLQRFAGDDSTIEEQLARSLRGEYEARGDDNWRADPADAGWRARPDDPRKEGTRASDREIAPERTQPEVTEPAATARKQGTGLLVSGAIVGVAGLAGVGVGAAGMVAASRANEFDPAQTPPQRREQIARGERGNVQAVVGLAAGGALTVVGVVLVATGAAKRKRSASKVALSPMRTPDGWGASITGRF